ncbi:MAG: 1-deoxy-D-xylulose-5-phosphate reductoisomerase, partial [Oscillospiraceae bacterium]|nr:1-deoxy-D-xylulose-5-phosphate reductoisomerase [Oscillospiraceae bacterium]
MRNLIILGSTGSIGRQTLEVCRCLRGTEYEYGIYALSGYRNTALLETQAREFNVPRTATSIDRILHIIDTAPENTLVLNALVGSIGIVPTLAAIERGFDIALAN